MMNQDFEQVVKNTFEHFEADVNPQVWANIQQGLQGTPPAGQSPAGSGASGIKAAAVLSKTAAVITSGVVVVATGLTIWYFAGKNTETQPVSSEAVTAPAPATVNAIPALESATQTNTQALPGSGNEPTAATANPVMAGTDLKTENISPEANAAGSVQNTTTNPVAEKQPVTDQGGSTTANPTTQADENVVRTENKSAQPVKAEAKELIQIYNKEPLAFISANPVSGNAPLTVNFNNTGYASSVQWDFGDGSAHDELAQTAHTFKTPGKYKVRLTATDKENKVFSDEIEVIVKDDESAVHSSVSEIQNVFTPNGDGYNDVFRIESSNLSSLNVMIFDASGKMIYQWTDPEGGWDGQAKGKTADGASYYYIIEASGKDGKAYRFKGTVRLIR